MFESSPCRLRLCKIGNNYSSDRDGRKFVLSQTRLLPGIARNWADKQACCRKALVQRTGIAIDRSGKSD